jgi:DNA/RNA-binding domain of Phe-tRNA-synthetase-like protein
MLKFDESVGTVYPGTKMGILVMKDVSYSRPYPEHEIASVLNELDEKYAHLERQELKGLYPVNAYIAYYKKFGYKYHLLAQLESVLKRKKALTSDSGLLLAMFLSEIDSMLLTAGHDLSKLLLPLQLKTADGTEIYRSISGKEVTAVSGDLILSDSNSAISSILRGPDQSSCITELTSEVLFSIYAPPGIDEDYIEINLRKLESKVITTSPTAKTEVLKVFS